MRQGVWLAVVLGCATAMLAQSGTKGDQKQPTNSQQTQGSSGATPAPPDAPKPSAAQMFPFPEDDSKTAGTPAANSTTPDAPVPSAPAKNDAAKQYPFPGQQPYQHPITPDPDTDGAYSSSNDSAPANDTADSKLDDSGRHKLVLSDVGGEGHIDTARAEKDEKVADFYEKDGNFMGAYLRYKDAVTYDPDDADAHFGLAEMARKTAKLDEAIAEFNATLKLEPKGDHAKAAQKAIEELEASGVKQPATDGEGKPAQCADEIRGAESPLCRKQ